MDYAELVNKEPDVYGLAATLLKEHKELSAMNKELKSESDYYKKEHIRLNFILSKLKCNKFSASSEKTKYIEEPKIFNEAGNIDEDNIENEDEALSTSTDDDKVNSNKKTTGRNKLPETLPNDEEFCDLSPEEKVCTCGCELTHLGDDKYTQLIYIPAKLSRKTYIKHKYACKSCGEVIRTAKAPLQPIPKSIASPSLLTQILISKYRDHLPLYRQEQILKEMDINLARCTLSNWMIKVGKLIQPLINLLRDKLLENNYIQADETTVQVLKEKDKKPSSKSYIWMYKTGYDKDGIAIYEYQPDRKGDNATNIF